MLCESCQIIFAFYMKYCRRCGDRLVEPSRPAAITAAMVSSNKRAEVEVDGYASRYRTAPATLGLSAQSMAIADVVRRVLDNFPSLDTVKMAEQLISARLRDLPGRMSDRLREFSLTEFTEWERSNAITAVALEIDSAEITVTLELPKPRVADTAPMALTEIPMETPTKAVSEWESVDPEIKLVSISGTDKPAMIDDQAVFACVTPAAALRESRQIPARLHLRPTQPQLNLYAPGWRKLTLRRWLDICWQVGSAWEKMVKSTRQRVKSLLALFGIKPAG
jgi:hypothetical protein